VIARALRDVPDRALHGWRRSAVRRRLTAAAPVHSACFVCHGNVCRSPFAGLLFARAMSERGLPVAVSSAGFIGPDRQPPAMALAAATRRGIDMAAHRSAVLTANALRAADLIVVMSAEQERALMAFGVHARCAVIVLSDLDPLPIVSRTVRDPWGGDERVFDESYDRIERCIGEMVRLLATAAGAPGR
jgi:protein-tyrosine phosphatase